MSEDTLDVRRITDLSYKAHPCFCCCRGTVEIFSGDSTDDHLEITTWFVRGMYRKLKEAWSLSKQTVAVEGQT